ncbi:TonB-dependent SusC/RagA subfamily outer membrane receptor [Flavobacterium araucananum]|nr:TonB-dependent SusC/RagA subfamily outer membrane receptor [Flavobacterium araucananum]
MKNVKLISLALSMLVCFVSMAQEKTITGTVTDQSKQPLPGVSVTVQKSKKTTQTNFDGNYTIQAQPGDVLMFSYIGMHNENIIVKQSNVINVSMRDNNNQLQEVVVVGYGTSEREDNSYSRVEKRRSTKADRALQGKVAPVQVSSGYVQAAPTKTVMIRGTQTLSAANEPLYIIDGIPVKSKQFAKINPNDVQDIKVLKDAAATSVYGSKAVNGVIVIETKNGIYKNLTEKELNAKLKNANNVQPVEPSQEDYNTFVENAFESPKTAPLSTFSIDVDNASYTNIRRFINNGQAVPKDAVRVEEMVNFFKYSYPQPKDQNPFSITTELSDSPWNSKNRILKIGLQGKIFQPRTCRLQIWYS